MICTWSETLRSSPGFTIGGGGAAPGAVAGVWAARGDESAAAARAAMAVRNTILM
jgi:hypothetical protein